MGRQNLGSWERFGWGLGGQEGGEGRRGGSKREGASRSEEGERNDASRDIALLIGMLLRIT